MLGDTLSLFIWFFILIKTNPPLKHSYLKITTTTKNINKENFEKIEQFNVCVFFGQQVSLAYFHSFNTLFHHQV